MIIRVVDSNGSGGHDNKIGEVMVYTVYCDVYRRIYLVVINLSDSITEPCAGNNSMGVVGQCL